MTLTGGIQKNGGVTKITGASASGGWQKVVTVDRAKFAAGGHYVFVIQGRVGAQRILSGAPVNTVVEVCPGDNNGPHYALTHRYEVADGWLSSGDVCMPMYWVIPVAADVTVPAHPVYGRSWPGSRDVVVWARIWLNGDPGPISCTVKVADCHVMWWDLDALGGVGGGRYVCEGTDYASPLFNPTTGAWGDFGRMSGTLGSAGEEWLAFWMLDYAPRHPIAAALIAPSFQLVSYNPYPTIDSTLVGSDRWGISPRGQNFSRFHGGGQWGLARPSGASFQLGFRGRDLHTNASYATAIWGVRIFAVRLDDLYEPRRVESASVTAMTSLTFGEFEQGALFPFEPSPPVVGPTEYVTLYHHIPKHPSNYEAFGAAVTDNAGNLIDGPFLPSVQLGPLGEGVPRLAVGRLLLGAGSDRYELYSWPLATNPPSRRYDCVDVQAVGFGFEDNPSNINTTVPAVPPAVIINPGHEALDVSMLPDLPVTPDAAAELDLLGDHVHRFRTDTGYVRTWGRFTGPRARWRFVWSAIDRTDVDSLLSFFTAHLTFRFAPATRSENAPFVVTRRPTAADSAGAGKYYSFSIEAMELVNTGP